MSQIIEQYRGDYDKIIEHLKFELSSIKTGRANPILVENIMVDAYGTKMNLQQLASISIPEAKYILIQPWDKSISKDIEKAIISSNRGLNPINEGDQIRIIISPLTAEDREKLVKLLSQKLEKAKVSIRGIRDKVRENILKLEKNKEIGEDDRFRFQKEADEITNEYNEKVKEAGEKKEEEINTI